MAGKGPKMIGTGARMKNFHNIKLGQERSYADVVGKLGRDVHPENSGVDVRRLCSTNDGRVFIKLGSGEREWGTPAYLRVMVRVVM